MPKYYIKINVKPYKLYVKLIFTYYTKYGNKINSQLYRRTENYIYQLQTLITKISYIDFSRYPCTVCKELDDSGSNPFRA
jgi:hypothetical protein